MATATVTNTFTNATTAVAAQVNTNFNDLLGFINTNAIQKDGSLAMTAQLSLLAADPTTANHATRKQYVDRADWNVADITIIPGAKIGAGPFNIGTVTIPDPGYDIEFYGLATVLAQGGALNYWQMNYNFDGIDRGAVVIPCAQTSVNQSFAAALSHQVHTTGSNLVINLLWSRVSGAADSTIAADGRYNGASILYRKH